MHIVTGIQGKPINQQGRYELRFGRLRERISILLLAHVVSDITSFYRNKDYLEK